MSEPNQPPAGNQPTVSIKIDDEELKGRYANLLRITHTREEFVLDFINLAAPQGIVTARIVTSPGHLKRTLRALELNLRRYEEAFGEIHEAPPPAGSDRVN
ncbi:MAG TPA: DUF3467 domain-containing protein [Thermoanaerobaculia bacterium]|nr:DUF3467 domain-containing protein [Thermoanaerobaculia bacterium]